MKKLFIVTICFFALVTSNGQAVEQRLPGAEEISNRRTSFNLEEIKVRWKKAALENCTGVPCIVTPPAPSFTCVTSTVADIDGNSYNTVLIGSQCWTKSNLKVTKYNDGTAIPDETANTAGWAGLTTGARSDYTGATSYIPTYGYLYNWYAAKGVSTSGSTTYKNICPTGWHVPTDAEWTALVTQLGGASVAGGKMKSTGTANWVGQSAGTDNSSGFSALPGGARDGLGGFAGIRTMAWFLSATENGGLDAWLRELTFIADNVDRPLSINKTAAASVRCLKD
jgi:uncharacterized protein (TIGR02145 family)